MLGAWEEERDGASEGAREETADMLARAKRRLCRRASRCPRAGRAAIRGLAKLSSAGQTTSQSQHQVALLLLLLLLLSLPHYCVAGLLCFRGTHPRPTFTSRLASPGRIVSPLSLLVPGVVRGAYRRGRLILCCALLAVSIFRLPQRPLPSGIFPLGTSISHASALRKGIKDLRRTEGVMTHGPGQRVGLEQTTDP